MSRECRSTIEDVIAYYNPVDNKVAFNDAFFKKDPTERLQVLLHESVHASIQVDGAPVPDYYYLRSPVQAEQEGAPHPTTKRRNEQLKISQAALGFNYFIGNGKHILSNNFIKGMNADSIMQAAIRFMENPAARRRLLMKNPDTQSLLVMELAGKVPGTIRHDGFIFGIDSAPASPTYTTLTSEGKRVRRDTNLSGGHSRVTEYPGTKNSLLLEQMAGFAMQSDRVIASSTSGIAVDRMAPPLLSYHNGSGRYSAVA
ncbi:hypothetical protein Rin_00018540 [Candidatus Regiella insecticola 5.15]|uniref:Uncharacterized protein n=1 Tax=Candidatus Regiella insecticola 5.15 TaxID=1005043 RepID=G2H1B2_9ENTR|nr:hypothetical protein [Candidatus Regiella insecticola]EGY28212.1 hypothetical protein Rin_00018540 [Candidatus Regiella insecticola 5.15]